MDKIMRVELKLKHLPVLHVSPVDIVLNAQQVVGHGLQGQLMQQRGHRVKATI